jgi:hypothetical protein
MIIPRRFWISIRAVRVTTLYMAGRAVMALAPLAGH